MFTLLEDQCHALDVEMALLSSPQAGDRQVFIEFATALQRERALLDERERFGGELKWLEQTLSHLALHSTSTNPACDPTMVAVATAIKTKKEQMKGIVSDQLLESRKIAYTQII